MMKTVQTQRTIATEGIPEAVDEIQALIDEGLLFSVDPYEEYLPNGANKPLSRLYASI